MAYVLIFCCFMVLGAVSALAARTGYSGDVCRRSAGYEVPDAVQRDPALRQRANRLVAFWCTGAAVLSLAPLVPAGLVIMSDGGRSVSTPGLLAFAGYAFAVVVVCRYPFEKIKHLAS